jgi:hypothetical protein
VADSGGRDLFISYAGVNRPWVGVDRGAAGGRRVLDGAAGPWDLQGARAQLERALAISEAVLPRHRYVAIWRNNLASVLHQLGDLEGARVQYERALEIAEAALGPDHQTVATIRGNLGSVLAAVKGRRLERTRDGTSRNIGERWLNVNVLSLAPAWAAPPAAPARRPRSKLFLHFPDALSAPWVAPPSLGSAHAPHVGRSRVVGYLQPAS